MKNKIKILSILFALMLIFTACGENSNSVDKNSLEGIKAKEKIVLGTSADYPPMEWIIFEGSTENYVGVDIEIAKVIAKDLGVELEISNRDFGGLLTALNAGDIDMVLAGMVKDEERAKEVDFSNAYYDGGQVVLVRDEDVEKYKTPDDLIDKKIGTQLGTTQQKYAEEHFGKNITSMDSNMNLVMDLKNKSLDMLFMSELAAMQFASINEDLEVIKMDEIPGEGEWCVAVKKGNQELLDEINKTIEKLLESKQIDKWFDEYIELSKDQLE